MVAEYVLIHGAWHGGWCWERVSPLLVAEGQRVHAPTLVGLGDRSAEATRDTGSVSTSSRSPRCLKMRTFETPCSWATATAA